MFHTQDAGLLILLLSWLPSTYLVYFNLLKAKAFVGHFQHECEHVAEEETRDFLFS